MGQSPLVARAMAQPWRDLYQAVFVHQLLICKNKPQSASQVALGVRQLAPVTGETPPWAVTPDQVQQAYNAVLQANELGKVALNFAMTVRNVLDRQKLADSPSLVRFCIPFPSVESQAGQQRADAVRAKQNTRGGVAHMRDSLAERKSEAKLPEQRAFWELVRIVFAETPRSFSDAIRFAALKLQIIMGFRIGEAALLPFDRKRWREYFDMDGHPAGEQGGFSRSLMNRHFAEKQVEDERPDGASLY